MNLNNRIRTILKENGLKQKDLANEIGVTESYISAIVNQRNTNLSQSLATLIEEKYGYNVDWILTGQEPKLKQVSKNKTLSPVHQKALTQLEKMTDAQVKAVLAFINSLDEVEKNLKDEDDNEKE